MSKPHSPDPQCIREMFGSIADLYDRANTILSGGLHHRWRKKLVAMSGAQEGDAVLDCATGTGDLAIAFQRCVGNGIVIGIDFCREMILHAQEKSRRLGMNILFEEADVENLPFEDKRFDITSIAFGIRNVGHPVRTLLEMARVTKPGSLVIVLEFGQPSLPIWKTIYGVYASHLLPMIGGWITGKRDAYRYLNESSAHFPCREEFVKLMRDTLAFDEVRFRSLCGGVAYIYKGRVKTADR